MGRKEKESQKQDNKKATDKLKEKEGAAGSYRQTA